MEMMEEYEKKAVLIEKLLRRTVGDEVSSGPHALSIAPIQ
jgi:hypothetical protein